MQVISKTGFDGLDFVCRGAVPPNPSELLMHPRFKALLDWAAEHYDFVIVDSRRSWRSRMRPSSASMSGRLCWWLVLPRRL